MTTDADPKPLTPRQAEVLEFIRANMAYYSPTVRQIAQQFNIRSPNGVVCHLKALEKKGLITIRRNVARGIEVIA
jgi:repressor LexA